MLKHSKNTSNNKIIEKLVLDNCLTFGRHPKLTHSKITKYVFGTRHAIDIFKLYELRYLLLKIYPLIHNLFFQNRLNMEIKPTYKMETSELYKMPRKANVGHTQQSANKYNKTPKPRKANVVVSTPKPMLPRILFATTTPSYANIVHSAAKICQMPFHQNRWLCGSITAASSYVTDIQQWSFLTDKTTKEIQSFFGQTYYKNKVNVEQRKNKVLNSQKSRRPSLIVIPDISNNPMIIEETNMSGIPVIGLVNSDCKLDITYPIFGNDQSIHSVHFFCHFLATLIAKEIVKNQHKVYTAPRLQRNKKAAYNIKSFTKKYQSFVSKFEAIQNKIELRDKYQRQPLLQYFSKKYLIKQKTQETASKLYHWKYKQRLIPLKNLLKPILGWTKKKVKIFLEQKPYLLLFYNNFLNKGKSFYAFSSKEIIQNENRNRLKRKKQFFSLNWKEKKKFSLC